MPDAVGCSSCGRPARVLVTLPYEADWAAGRVLVYCMKCRTTNPNVLISIPLELVDSRVFTKL
jgi:hypothetical protein